VQQTVVSAVSDSGVVATAGCANMPGMKSIMPGAAATSNQTWTRQLSHGPSERTSR